MHASSQVNRQCKKLCLLLLGHLTIVLQEFTGYELVGYTALLEKDQFYAQICFLAFNLKVQTI